MGLICWPDKVLGDFVPKFVSSPLLAILIPDSTLVGVNGRSSKLWSWTSHSMNPNWPTIGPDFWVRPRNQGPHWNKSMFSAWLTSSGDLSLFMEWNTSRAGKERTSVMPDSKVSEINGEDDDDWLKFVAVKTSRTPFRQQPFFVGGTLFLMIHFNFSCHFLQKRASILGFTYREFCTGWPWMKWKGNTNGWEFPNGSNFLVLQGSNISTLCSFKK